MFAIFFRKMQMLICCVCTLDSKLFLTAGHFSGLINVILQKSSRKGFCGTKIARVIHYFPYLFAVCVEAGFLSDKLRCWTECIVCAAAACITFLLPV